MKTIRKLAAAIAGMMAAFTRGKQGAIFCNAETVGSGVHVTGNKTYKADAAIATKHFVVETGTDEDHVQVSNSNLDRPIGIATDEAAAAEDEINVAVFGVADGTLLMVASAAIVVNAEVISNGDGKIVTLPGAAATYYIIGIALQAAAADGDVIEIAHMSPVQRVVT